MTNRNTAAVIGGLEGEAAAKFEFHRKEVRGAYLRAVSEIVDLDNFDHRDDRFLDVLDVQLSSLFVRAGALDNNEMFRLNKTDPSAQLEADMTARVAIVAEREHAPKPAAPVTRSTPGYIPGDKPPTSAPSQYPTQPAAPMLQPHGSRGFPSPPLPSVDPDEDKRPAVSPRNGE